MRTIAIVNQKGGCGKTTIAINLAAELARRGHRTLLVDMDPQSHCAAGLGVPESSIEKSLADALPADLMLPATTNGLVWEVSRNLDLLPSTMRLAGLEAAGGGLHQLPDKDLRLARLLSVLHRRRDTGASRPDDAGGAYDWCLIDCPPTIGLLTYNALRAAGEAIIPVETGYLAFKGAEKQWMTIERLVGRIGRPLRAHLVATLHDAGLDLANQILASLRREFRDDMAPVVIESHNEIREATSFGQPVIEFAPSSRAARQFAQLAEWLEGLAGDVPRFDDLDIAVLSRTDQLAGLHDPTTIGAAHVDIPCTPDGPAPGPRGQRAADVARRVRELIQRSHDSDRRPSTGHAAVAAEPVTRTESNVEARPTTSPVDRAVAEPISAAPAASPHREPVAPSHAADTSTFGVIIEDDMARFVQPASIGRAVYIAGDFNHWSPASTPLRLTEDGTCLTAAVPVPSGRHQYRLVVDGQWMADPHNAMQVTNQYGEPNSIVDIPPRRETREHDARQ